MSIAILAALGRLAVQHSAGFEGGVTRDVHQPEIACLADVLFVHRLARHPLPKGVWRDLMFYKGDVFPQWNGSGLGSEAIVRVTFDGKGGATAVDRWSIGKRVRDIEEAPDGTLWMLEDASLGALFHLTPK